MIFLCSWDRWVLNESVLKESDENKQLQKKLYEKAVGFVQFLHMVLHAHGYINISAMKRLLDNILM